VDNMHTALENTSVLCCYESGMLNQPHLKLFALFVCLCVAMGIRSCDLRIVTEFFFTTYLKHGDRMFVFRE
jgi:hypothetical protein